MYVADQSQFPTISDDELHVMDAAISSLCEKLRVSQDAARHLESQLRAISSAPTTEDASHQLANTSTECKNLMSRLKNLQTVANAVSPEERKLVFAVQEKTVKEWRKRKRMAMDIVNTVLEGYPKTKKQFLEEVGVETDEDYNMKPPEL